MKRLFEPLRLSNPRERQMVLVVWAILCAGIWIIFRPAIMPNPLQIITTIPSLMGDGLMEALTTSLITNVQAAVLAIIFSYVAVVGRKITATRPLSDLLEWMKFLSPATFFVVLLFVFKSGHGAKLGMMVLGETFFLTAALNKIVDSIPESSYDEAKVLRMSSWQQLWYVTIRGTLAQTFDAVQDVMAMGWAMLPMVEGAIRSEGGVGVLMLNQSRYLNFDAVYGIALTVLVVGFVQDWLVGFARGEVCPHTKI